MLLELRVRDLLLIEEAELRFGPGLNVLTGETGAGKTVLAHALDLLLGGRPRAGIVRPGAQEAIVEGTFQTTPALALALAAALPDEEHPDGEITLTRRVQAGGRTRALLNGATTTVGALRAASEVLLSFYGQHEHRKLTVASSQREILDAYCGEEQARRLARCAQAHARALEAAGRLEELRALDAGRERELDILAHEIAEIDAAAPDPEAEAGMLAARERLGSLERLRDGAAVALGALESEDGEGAAARLAAAGAAAAGAGEADPALAELGGRLAAAALEASDVAAELRSYLEGLDMDPGELDLVEGRLAEWDRLKRKHGGSLHAVLEYADQARERREMLEGSQQAAGEAQAVLEVALAERTEACEEIRAARRQAARKLAGEVEGRLADLAMPGATFQVELRDADPGPSGADAVEFLVAPNPGVPAGAVREIASGGELSRVMLALLGIASSGSQATLVFDEVDAGIGGQTANAVGEQLLALSEGRQVVCITHLPQVAALAGCHFAIAKQAAGGSSTTVVSRLDGEEVIGELVRMLGAEPGDEAATGHARRLRNATLSQHPAAA